MKIQNLATLLLLSFGLAACGSSGNSNGDEVNRLKQELSETGKKLEEETAKMAQETKEKEEALKQLANKEAELKQSQDQAKQTSDQLKQEQARLAAEIAEKRQALDQLTAKQKVLDQTKNDLKAAEEKLRQVELMSQGESLAKQKALKDLDNAKEAVKLAEEKLKLEAEKLKLSQDQVTNLTRAKAEVEADLANKEQELKYLNSKLQVLEKEKQAQLLEAEKLAVEKQRVAEENARYIEEEKAWFKSQMGSEEMDKWRNYGNKFNVETRNFSYIEVDGKKMDVDRNLPFERKAGSRIYFGQDRGYVQNYSAVLGRVRDARVSKDGETTSSRFTIDSVIGDLTSSDVVAQTKGTANYQGIAFGAYGVGNFAYTVDFDNKSGSGSIKNLVDVADVSDVVLHEGKIDGNIIQSSVVTENPFYKAEGAYGPVSGTYTLGLYGPNAEEVAGRVVFDNVPNSMRRANLKTPEGGNTAHIGFAGTKQ
ncbi:hypothetical protein A4G20_01660 [Pasteurellaceae bacterium RH1A]|nr:hypothetical protein A4G20_01660 [Pasteurellaceae bacterium RH1A]